MTDYDEIELLKPSVVTEAGYRLYDDEALVSLQQILFFKELDMSEYYNVLEEFKKENKDKVIRQFGSVKKYAEAVKKNLNN